MNKIMVERVTKFKDEQASIQRNNEKVMAEHKMRLSANSETLVKHRELLDENKHLMIANQDLINKIGTKLERTRDNLQNEIVNVNNDIQSKIDHMDKFYLDQMTSIENVVRSDRTDVKTQIDKTNEAFKQQL